MKMVFKLYTIQLSFIVFILCAFSFKTTASNYYWVGGTGNWSDLNHWATTSGGPVIYTQIPTAIDDVFFDSNSFSSPGQIVTLDAATVLVRDFIWSGVTNTPTLSGPSTNLLKVYGSLKFVTGMNMNFLGPINFEATTAGHNILMSNKSFNERVIFNGIGGEWTFLDAFKTSSRITLNKGSLITNNQSVSALQFYSITPGVRSLNMGASVFNLSGSNICWWVEEIALMTLNSGTSVINIIANNASPQFRGGSMIYYNLNFTGSNSTGMVLDFNNFHDVTFISTGYIFQSNTFHNVYFYGDGKMESNNTYNNLTLSKGHSYFLWNGATQTVNGVFSASGDCNELITINSNIAGNPAMIMRPNGTVSISYAVLKDIHASGGANFIANNSIDLGNNSGWTINSPASQNLFWVGNTGNWQDGNHWSYSSGGSPSGCSPNPFTNVFFDSNSFSATGQTVSITAATAYCKNMSWAGVTNSPVLAGPSSSLLEIYGSLGLSVNMNMTFGGPVNFEAITPGNTISMANKMFLENVNFNGIGGEWLLQDAFSTLKRITLNCGILTTNNQSVSAAEFYSTATPFTTHRTLNMGASNFYITGSSTCWYVSSGNFNLNCGTSTIHCINAAADFRGGDLTYYNLNFTNNTSGAAVYLSGSNTFHDVLFACKGYIIHSNSFHKTTFLGDGIIESDNSYDDLIFSAAHSYSLWSYAPNLSTTQTINGNLTAIGNCGGLIDIHSKAPGVPAIIYHPAGNINTSFLVLKDIHATGGANFTASNSVDLGNNIGWTITPANSKDLYWIANGGNWNDGNHWSLSSGGPPSGCIPTPLDNVFFDGNSFSVTGQNVLLNTTAAYCRNITWTGATHNPTFGGSLATLLKIYGSLEFVPGMNTSFAGKVNFESTTTGKTIHMAGHSFYEQVNFNGIGGGWKFLSAFSTTGEIWLNNGEITTNDQTVNAAAFYTFSLSGATRILNMGASIFNLSDDQICWYATIPTTGLVLNHGTSVINSTANNSNVAFFGGGLTYYDLNFKGIGTSASATLLDNNHFHNVSFLSKAFINQSNTFQKLTFHADGTIKSNSIYNNLNFAAGHTYTLWSGTTHTINNNWQIQGTCTSYIILQTNNGGNSATISKNAGAVLGYNIHIKDMKCIGGSNFIAYNSVDLGGNTGWNFLTLPPLSNPGVIVGPSQVCSGAIGVVYHIAQVQGAISYQWSVPPGATIVSGQGDTLIIVNFGTAVSGNINVQSFNGCNPGTNGSTFAVVLATQLIPTVILAANPLGIICPGTTIIFIATATNTGSSSVNYNFKLNGISVQNGISSTYTTNSLANNDRVTCSISISAGTCYVSATSESNAILINVSSGSPTVVIDVSTCANQLPYNWNGQSYTSSGVYFKTLTNSGGCDSLIKLNLTVMPMGSGNCNCIPTIPNAFTPNGDGINDRWIISFANCNDLLAVSVYNRYGSLVYHSDNYKNEWTGVYKLKPCPDGTYYYVVKTTNSNRNEQFYKGNVTILR